MKPKHHFPLVLVSLPILLLIPVTYAQDQEKDEIATEGVEAGETKEEKANARRAEEAAKRIERANERAKDAAERANERATERAEKATEKATKRAERAEREENADDRAAERAKKAAEKSAPLTDPTNEEKTSVAPDKKTEITPQPPVEEPGVPSETRKPRREVNPRDNPVVPEEKETHEPAIDEVVKPEIVEIPATEPERLAETKVTEVTREVQRDLDQRKTQIEGKKQAQAVIDEILGAESRISRAEIAREERFRTRLDRQRQGEERLIEVSPDQRREATTYFQERLRGREVEGPPPEFFRRSERRGDRRGDRRVEDRVIERVEFVRPRYLNDGRRYVHYNSRAAIPAILMAAQAMNQVRFQPTREIAPIFYEGQDVSTTHTMPLPPENYRGENSWVVSYPVDEKSMISSEDILFLQGTTQFSDPYSYEVVGIMAEAMKAMPAEERFVIEGHASAEGSYESNMILSQQRAEHIVREIVRRGVSPYRLLPVGYGESEARNPDHSAEALRRQDRRVVVFRMKSEPIAKR